MKILITGATGFIGDNLIQGLIQSGQTDIRVLTRDKEKFLNNSNLPLEVYQWNIENMYIEPGALENVDAVIHLAGEGVADGRWTNVKKKKILESRVLSTSLLMGTIRHASTVPKKFISASAIGIYGNRDDEELCSESKLGDDFLSKVCQEWERVCLDHNISGMHSTSLRIGLVLGKDGGALSKMAPAFKAGVGGVLGTGQQYMSWIHIKDLVGQMMFLLDSNGKNSVYNGVTPRPVTNKAFTEALGKVLKRPTIFPVPKFVLRGIFGEMSQILIDSQRVVPKNFINEGYSYQFPTLEKAFADLFNLHLKGERTLKRLQWIDESLDDVFNFFSNAKNLEKLTPSSLKFSITDKQVPSMKEGTIINYKLHLYGVPLNWRSRISNFEYNKCFKDIQVTGPYNKWEHTHEFIPFKGGTLMIDEVIYKVPLGVLGNLFSGFAVKNELNKIFNFRRQALKQFFT